MLPLAEPHPDAGLAPAVGDTDRAEFRKGLVWLTATLHPQMPMYFYSDRYVATGNADGAAEVKAQAQARIASMIDQLEARFADGRTWMLGERFSVLDPYVFMLCRWTRVMARPARTLPHLGAFLQRMLARPAVQAVVKAEGLQPPLV